MNYDEISVSAWFYKNANDTTNADAIFGGYRWNSSVSLQEGLNIRFYQLSPNRLDFILVTKDTSGNRISKTVSKTFTDSTGAWHHLTATYDKASGQQKLSMWIGLLAATQTHIAGNTIVPLTKDSTYTDMRLGYSWSTAVILTAV